MGFFDPLLSQHLQRSLGVSTNGVGALFVLPSVAYTLVSACSETSIRRLGHKGVRACLSPRPEGGLSCAVYEKRLTSWPLLERVTPAVDWDWAWSDGGCVRDSWASTLPSGSAMEPDLRVGCTACRTNPFWIRLQPRSGEWSKKQRCVFLRSLSPFLCPKSAMRACLDAWP